MKLLSYGLEHRMEPRLAFSLNGYAVDVMRAALWMKDNKGAQDFLNLPSSMKIALEDWSRSLSLMKELENAFLSLAFDQLSIYGRAVALPESDIVFFAPVPDPSSLRYFQSFHLDKLLSFEFGNTQTLLGHQQALHAQGLAAQVEMAAMLSADKDGSKPSIAGYCIANNWFDPRSGQDDGLSWGKATSLGPYLLTADELDSHRLGSGFNLDFQFRVNGETAAEGRFKEMKLSFEGMLTLALSTRIKAGDILCSGAPLNLGRKFIAQQGDLFEIEIQALGTLASPIE